MTILLFLLLIPYLFYIFNSCSRLVSSGTSQSNPLLPGSLQPHRDRPLSGHAHHIRPHQNGQWSGATETAHHLNPATHGSPRMAPNISGECRGIPLFLISVSGIPLGEPNKTALEKPMLCSINVHLVLKIIGALLFWPQHISIGTVAWNWN